MDRDMEHLGIDNFIRITATQGIEVFGGAADGEHGFAIEYTRGHSKRVRKAIITMEMAEQLILEIQRVKRIQQGNPQPGDDPEEPA